MLILVVRLEREREREREREEGTSAEAICVTVIVRKGAANMACPMPSMMGLRKNLIIQSFFATPSHLSLPLSLSLCVCVCVCESLTLFFFSPFTFLPSVSLSMTPLVPSSTFLLSCLSLYFSLFYSSVSLPLPFFFPSLSTFLCYSFSPSVPLFSLPISCTPLSRYPIVPLYFSPSLVIPSPNSFSPSLLLPLSPLSLAHPSAADATGSLLLQ